MRKAKSSDGGRQNNPVTKGEFRQEIGGLKKSIDGLEGRMGGLKDKFREYRDEVMDKLADIVGQLSDMREKNAITSSIHRRVVDVEDKVEKLERIHPQGQHANT